MVIHGTEMSETVIFDSSPFRSELFIPVPAPAFSQVLLSFLSNSIGYSSSLPLPVAYLYLIAHDMLLFLSTA